MGVSFPCHHRAPARQHPSLRRTGRETLVMSLVPGRGANVRCALAGRLITQVEGLAERSPGHCCPSRHEARCSRVCSTHLGRGSHGSGLH